MDLRPNFVSNWKRPNRREREREVKKREEDEEEEKKKRGEEEKPRSKVWNFGFLVWNYELL